MSNSKKKVSSEELGNMMSAFVSQLETCIVLCTSNCIERIDSDYNCNKFNMRASEEVHQ